MVGQVLQPIWWGREFSCESDEMKLEAVAPDRHSHNLRASRSANFMLYRTVDRRILELPSCERVAELAKKTLKLLSIILYQNPFPNCIPDGSTLSFYVEVDSLVVVQLGVLCIFYHLIRLESRQSGQICNTKSGFVSDNPLARSKKTKCTVRWFIVGCIYSKSDKPSWMPELNPYNNHICFLKLQTNDKSFFCQLSQRYHAFIAFTFFHSKSRRGKVAAITYLDWYLGRKKRPRALFSVRLSPPFLILPIMSDYRCHVQSEWGVFMESPLQRSTQKSGSTQSTLPCLWNFEIRCLTFLN